jgi:uncharacterized membrane protein HdeD (DUF308 family)
MVVGVALVVFGIAAILAPALAGTAVVIVIGALLIVSGLVQFVQGLREPSWRSKLLPLIMGAISTLAGVSVLAHPWLGLEVLTLVLAVVFVIEGIWKIFVSFSFRAASGWLAMLLSGVLALILGVLIWMQWPLSGMWAIGVLVGVDLIMTGAAMIALAVTIRRAAKIVKSAA